jgi:hypothetical protein
MSHLRLVTAAEGRRTAEKEKGPESVTAFRAPGCEIRLFVSYIGFRRLKTHSEAAGGMVPPQQHMWVGRILNTTVEVSHMASCAVNARRRLMTQTMSER